MARCNVRLETALRTQKSVLHVLNISVGGAEKRVSEVRKFVQVWVQGSLFLKAVFLFYYPVKLFVCSLILSHSEIDGQISVLNIFPMSFKPFFFILPLRCFSSRFFVHIFDQCKFCIDLILLPYIFSEKSTKSNKWSDEGFNFTGAPLIIAGTNIFDCQHSKERKVIAKKSKRKEIKRR